MRRRRFTSIFLLLAITHTQAGGLFWTDRGASQLKRMNFDGSGLQTILLSGDVTSPGSNIRGIAVDAANNRIFWADNGADQLLRANLDGAASVVLHGIAGGNSFPADVRIDPIHKLFYWCDQSRNRIQRSTFDGNEVIDVVTNAAATGPYFMDLDLSAGKVYWGDFDAGSIYRADLDGSSKETLLTGINKTRGVRVDSGGGMLYWINRDDKKVQRCPLSAFANGTISVTNSAVQTLYSDLDTPHGLVLDIAARKLYWADTGTNTGDGNGDKAVCRKDFDGSTPMEVLATGVEPWDVDVDLRCNSYAEWRMRFFRKDAPPEQTNPKADPDGDRIPNALEYAYGLPPLQADQTGLPEGFLLRDSTSNTVYPALIYRRRAGATDLTYYVQAAGELKTWAGSPANPEGVEIEVTELGDGIEQTTVRSLQILSANATQFMRLAVALGP
jgi:DNA-binding beta-propeller fold protein YncE